MKAHEILPEHIPDRYQFALDKTPINPDTPLRCGYTVHAEIPF